MPTDPRDVFRTTMTQALADGTLKGLAGIEITVFVADTSTTQNIYQRQTGATTGPAPETGGAAAGANGMTTGAGGAVEFWLPLGMFDIHVRDTIVPARIMTRGYSSGNPPIKFGSLPVVNQALTTGLLSQDGGIFLSHLAADVLRQLIPIGQVIDWWRPNSGIGLPVGFEICDGRTIPTGSHDFAGVVGGLVLPDLRNKFIIGADVLKADAAASSNGDGTAAYNVQHPNAPGIRGVGGSNAVKNLDHAHVVNGHKHTVTESPHTHTSQGSGTGISIAGGDHGHDISSFHVGPQGGSSYWGDQWHHLAYAGLVGSPNTLVTVAYIAYHSGSYCSAITGKAYGASHTHSVSDPGHSHTINSASTGITVGAAGAPDGNNNMTTSTATGGTGNNMDMRPQHVGLLKLMKVRRA